MKSVDILTKEAQDRLDATLAEIDRLKNVKSGLENSNKVDEVDFNKEKTIRAAEIKALEDDTNTALVNKKEVVAKLEIELAKKIEIEDAIKTLKGNAQDIETEIFVKTTTLETLNTSLNTVSKDIQNQKDTHAALMRSNEQEALRFIDASNKQKNETADSLRLAKIELEAVNTKIISAQETLNNILKQVKGTFDEISEIEHKKKLVNKEFSDLNDNLNIIKSELELNTKALVESKKEIETTQAELKPLIAKRIESITFIEELNNRENNLKKRYADVGLEY